MMGRYSLEGSAYTEVHMYTSEGLLASRKMHRVWAPSGRPGRVHQAHQISRQPPNSQTCTSSSRPDLKRYQTGSKAVPEHFRPRRLTRLGEKHGANQVWIYLVTTWLRPGCICSVLNPTCSKTLGNPELESSTKFVSENKYD
jgi:hypothetical protein